ncbi:DUF1439 domain-containing protein [Methylophilus sp. DW102]|uniref:DUF1439 domain-containing protein n=1 Tax=Methylophilus sp. DW102 TaxID=3095607 RepID=UPI00309100A4|nr:DUF1439 domain-containing protein [Methylophilus sp. DW102]
MRQLIGLCLSVLLVLLLSHCVSLGERTLHINTAQLQQKLNRKLEKPITLMRIFHLQLSNALVSVEPGSGRIHALMDANVRSDLLANSATGKLGLSGLLQFDQAQQAVVLDQPEVDSLQLDGAGSEWSNLAQQLAKDIGRQWFKQVVLYEVKPEDLSYAGRKYQPDQLKVTPEGLSVTLKPQ